MEKSIVGIHHVTAIASDPQRNLDFFATTLGLRLVKLTVNFDDPGAYHFYFGDDLGRPGTLLTFFPWPGAPPGRRGTGQVSSIAFSVPLGSLDYWGKRLQEAGVAGIETKTRFAHELISFADPDGIGYELVADPQFDLRSGWGGSMVPREYAIRGLYSATLSVEGFEHTSNMLTSSLGFRPSSEEGGRHRFVMPTCETACILDILCLPNCLPGTVGTGTIHHIAFRTPSEAEQNAWQWKMAHAGVNVTPIVDRQYFHSIYFREPGGVLFEIATDPPGFTVDETADELGTHLCLPPQYEPLRDSIEQALPKIALPSSEPQRAEVRV